jgi:Flp pilus assembly protein CpaB
MSRRARAIVFAALALLAAATAAAIANGYGSSVARGYGPLRPVIVLTQGLRPDGPLGPEDLSAALAVRRVPERFVPPGALVSPTAALGLVPASPLSAGSYLLASQLHPPRPRRRSVAALGDRRPVEISVSGADALLAIRGPSPGAKVDVVVTTEPAGAGAGRTYVAAAGVPLLALGPGADGPGPGGASAATLGLTRRQALRLIEAESFARKLTLLPAG